MSHLYANCIIFFNNIILMFSPGGRFEIWWREGGQKLFETAGKYVGPGSYQRPALLQVLGLL